MVAQVVKHVGVERTWVQVLCMLIVRAVWINMKHELTLATWVMR